MYRYPKFSLYNKTRFSKWSFHLGNEYIVNGTVCRFIKVTPKGFNFLDIARHRCVLKRHLYDRRFYGKPLPRRHTHVKTWIPEWLFIQKVDNARIA